MARKKRIKRKKSSESSDNGKSTTQSKSAKYDKVPSGSKGLMVDSSVGSISEALQSANSVLYDQCPPGTEQLYPSVFETPLKSNNSVSTAKDSSNLCNQLSMATGGENVQRSKMPMQEPSNADIMKYLQRIDLKLSEVDKRLKTLELVEKKVDSFEQEMKKLWLYDQDNNKSLDTKISRVETVADDAGFAAGHAQDKVTQLEKQNSALKDELVYIQSQSMRNNLIFSNIPEDVNEKPEVTESKLRAFLVEKLRMAQDAVEQIQFDRVHRFGNRTNSMIYRRIVAKFSFYKQREDVRKLRKNLEHTEFYISEQFPKEVSDKRKALVPKMLKARREGKEAWISYDKLYIGGRLVRDSQVDEESMQADSEGATGAQNRG